MGLRIIKLTRAVAFSICGILFLSFVVVENDGDIAITKENYNKVITDVFYGFTETENTSKIREIVVFITKNKTLSMEDSIRSKYLYLKGIHEALTLSRYSVADSILKQSYAIAERYDDTYLQGTVLNDRAVISTYLNRDYDRTQKLYLRAIDFFKLSKNKNKQIETYYNLVVNRREKKEWVLANTYANKCLELIGDNTQLLIYYKRIFYFLSNNNIKLKNFPEAERSLQRLEDLLKLSEFKNKTRTYAWFYEAKSDLKMAEGDWTAAMACLKESALYWRKVGEEGKAEINKSFRRELELEEELQIEKDQIIADQKNMLILIVLILVLFVSLTLVLITFFRKIRKKNKEIGKLNKSLKKLVKDLKSKNSDLKTSKKDIENLLKLNEQTLFSRVLKISTYNDTIRKINEDIEIYLNNNTNAASFLVSLNKTLYNLVSEEELWEDFKIQFEKIRPEFFSKLKKVAPNLSINDLKHCTYIVSNLKSKEVAQLINVSPRSVETTRYRIKKKIGLNKEESLYNLLSGL